MRPGVRHSPRRIDQTITAATIVTPSASANTGTVVSTRQPAHDSTTSPLWSATQAAPAAASAIKPRNRMMRTIKTLLPGLSERGHGVGRELARRGERGVAGIGLVEPGLRRRPIRGRQRIQLAARIRQIIAQRRRGDARDNAAAVVADSIGALDTNQFGGAGLQAIDNACARRGRIVRWRRKLWYDRKQLAAQRVHIGH